MDIPTSPAMREKLAKFVWRVFVFLLVVINRKGPPILLASLSRLTGGIFIS